MAKNLQERLLAAKNPRARIADNEALLVDLSAEQARLEVAREQAAAESVDFALSEDDRDEAAAKAGRLDRTIKALATEIAAVAAITEERRSDDARMAAEAERRAAVTERDEIAARFAERVPAITAELIELFKQVQANADRMRMAGVSEANAEFHARGVPGNGMMHGAPVSQFTNMKIPEFASAARAWPFDWQTAAAQAELERGTAQWHKHLADTGREKREKAEAAAKFAREHGKYRITVEPSVELGDRIVRLPEEVVGGNIPATFGPWQRRELVLRHEVAEKLAAVPRLNVTRIDGGKK